MERAGARCRVAGAPSWPGDSVEPGHGSRREALPGAWIQTAVPQCAAPDKLQRRPHAGARSFGYQKYMSPRDTGTGGVLEDMILPALKRGGYEVLRQVLIHERPGGRRHKV